MVIEIIYEASQMNTVKIET